MNTPIKKLIEFALNQDSPARPESLAGFSTEEAWLMASRVLGWLRESGKPPGKRRAGWRADAPVDPEMAAFLRAAGLDSALEVRNNALAFTSHLSDSDRDALLATVASKYRPPIWIN